MREIIFLLALASANSGIALRAVEPMLPQLAEDFGTSISATALIISAYAFAYAGSQLLYGPIGDRLAGLMEMDQQRGQVVVEVRQRRSGKPRALVLDLEQGHDRLVRGLGLRGQQRAQAQPPQHDSPRGDRSH